ncbi:MAG: hypothetical protein AVDCRST_MAG87-2661, partial [uncultured Thermomicrobiales bacterium]
WPCFAGCGSPGGGIGSARQGCFHGISERSRAAHGAQRRWPARRMTGSGD